MNDDLEFLRTHVPEYAGYADEAARHATDMRVRAFAGERLTAARDRAGTALDAAASAEIGDTELRCMFTDQVFIRRIEHAELDDATVAAIERADRELVEIAVKLETAAPAELADLARHIDRCLEARRAPLGAREVV